MSFTFSSAEEQLAAEMRRRIRTGLWKETTPGIHKLRREFGLGRTVVEKAIAELLRTGELLPGGHGMPMRIAPRPPSRPDTATGCLIVYNLPEYQRSGEIPLLIESLARALPGPVDRLRVDPFEPPSAILERLNASEVRHIVTIGVHAEVAEALTAAGRSVVAAGGPGEFVRTPMVRVDFEQLVREAFRKTFARGHTRATLPIWRRHPESITRLRTWVREEYERAGLRHSVEFDTPVIADESPAAMHACVRELFRHTPPTALVLLDFPQWVATVTTLNTLRRRVPEEVSIVLLAHASELAAAAQSVAHFRHPVAEITDLIRGALRNRDLPPGTHNLAPLWVPGDSLAEPRKPERAP